MNIAFVSLLRAILTNRFSLLAAQHELSRRDDCNFRELTLIQKAVIGEIQQNIISFDARSIEEAEIMITNLVLFIAFSQSSNYSTIP